MHGQIDNSGTLQARANYNWIELPTPQHEIGHEQAQQPKITSTSKLQAQLSRKPGGSMVVLEHEYQGLDYNVSLKTQNMNPLDKAPSYSPASSPSVTGTFSVSYLQAISKSLSLGAEWSLTRPYPDLSEAATALALRYFCIKKICTRAQ